MTHGIHKTYQWVVLDGLLNDEHTKDSKHCNTAVLSLGLAPLLHRLEIIALAQTKRVEGANGREGSWKTPSKCTFIGNPAVEAVLHRGGDASLGGWGEGGSGADKGGGDSKLHFGC